jgi:SAM-dependent methyltransferase
MDSMVTTMLARAVLSFVLIATMQTGKLPEHHTGMFADADSYERFMGRWSRLVASRYVDFALIHDGNLVLDVGCGTGALASTIVSLKPHCRVNGIDPSPEYVSYAKTRSAGTAIVYQVGDAQRLTFPDSMFDATVSLLVFNFIPDARKALSELRRVTRPGGSISAAIWDYGEGMQMLRTFWDAAVALDPAAERLDERHMPLCRAGELRALWQGAGLLDIEEKPLEIVMEFKSFEDYWNPFLEKQGPAGAYVASLSNDRRSALRDRLKQVMAGEGAREGLKLRARVWAVRGTVPE